MVGDRNQQSDDGPSFASRLAQEAHILAYGLTYLPQGFEKAGEEAIHSPGATLAKLGASTAIGIGLGFFTARLGLVASLARGFGTAGTLSMVTDVAMPLGSAMTAGWNSSNQKQLDEATSEFGNSLGSLAFDTLVQTPFAGAGAFGASRLRGSEPGVRLNFKVDPQFLAYHTIVNSEPERFVKADKAVEAFQDKAWDADRDAYQFLRNNPAFLPGSSPIPAGVNRSHLASLEGAEGMPGRAYHFLTDMTHTAEFQPLHQDALTAQSAVRTEWQANYAKTNAIMKELLGFQPNHDFDVFITHPSLRAGRFSNGTIEWTNRNDFPNYNTVYLWHETLHGEPRVDGQKSPLSHSVIQLLTDNELRVRLNGGSYGAETGKAPAPFDGHRSLQDVMRKMEPEWRQYLASPNKRIERFIDTSTKAGA